MTPSPASSSSQKELRGQIRRSRVLTASLRKYWLGVLPHLTEEECARLRELLAEGRLTLSGPSSTQQDAGSTA